MQKADYFRELLEGLNHNKPSHGTSYQVVHLLVCHRCNSECPPKLSTMSSQWRAYFGKRDLYHVGRKVRHENLVSNQLGKFKLSPLQKIEKLTFPALTLPQSENRNCMLSILGGEKLCLSRWKERIAWSSSSRDRVALRKSALKCTWANSLAFPGICLA